MSFDPHFTFSNDLLPTSDGQTLSPEELQAFLELIGPLGGTIANEVSPSDPL